MNQVFLLVVYEGPETFIIGLYPTQRSAAEDLLNRIRYQAGFPGLSALFEREFGISLIGLDNTALRAVMDDPDYGDLWDENVFVMVEPAAVGDIFDFTQWTEWAENNLYHALRMILRGQTGLLTEEWPYNQTHLFLKAFVTRN